MQRTARLSKLLFFPAKVDAFCHIQPQAVLTILPKKRASRCTNRRRANGMPAVLAATATDGRLKFGFGSESLSLLMDDKGHDRVRWLDIPPVWLAFCLALGWWQSSHLTLGLSLGPIWADLLGGLMVGGGLLLIALAVYEFRQHRTTVIPHDTPTALITTGIFSRTRNPIYLGDALILAGFLLFWDAVLSLPLIPLFVWWIEKRFVVPEENRNRRIFRADFARYEQQTKRWL